MRTSRYTDGSPAAGRVGRCARIIALFLLSPLAGIAADPPDPPPENDSSETRGLPKPAVRPLARPIRLPPAPRITNVIPNEEVIAGGIITLYGSELRASDLVVQLGTRRPITLQVLKSTSTSVRVKVPESAVTAGSPLTVRYPRSAVATLAQDFRVYPRPKFSNLTFRRGPRIGAPTEMEMTVSNYSGLEGARLIWYSDCWFNGTVDGHLPASGSTGKIPVSLDIRGNDPALGTTEDLMAVSGRRCSLQSGSRTGRVRAGPLEPERRRRSGISQPHQNHRPVFRRLTGPGAELPSLQDSAREGRARRPTATELAGGVPLSGECRASTQHVGQSTKRGKC